MNAETVSEAISAVYGALKSIRQAQVLDYVPPPGNVQSPCVIVDRNGLSYDEETFRVPVRAYVAASRHGTVEGAQARLDEVIDLVEDALADVSVQSSGRVAYIEGTDAWVADMIVTVSRI